MATRHQARQSIVSLLYAYEFNKENDKFIDEFLKEKKIKNEQKNFTLNLYNGVCEYLKQIDEQINQNLKEVERISKVEKAILRLSTYELLYTETDKAIIINEAVELGKELGNDNSSKLINGVLDSIKRNKN